MCGNGTLVEEGVYLPGKNNSYKKCCWSLTNIILLKGLDGIILWRYDVSGEYTIKSFSLQIFRSIVSSLSIYSQAKIAWKGVAPPRVKILVWFILLERLNTKDRLCCFGSIPANDSQCVLCSNNAESIQHLFFECPVAWMFWHSYLQWWGISWCYNNSPMLFFEAWEDAPFRGFEKKTLDVNDACYLLDNLEY